MATAKKKDGTKAVYKVLSNLEHDQVLYAPGDEVELTEAEAAPLLNHTVEAPAKAAG